MSNFRGYFLRFNTDGATSTFPHKYLAQKPTFTPNRRTEVEAFRDANNNLHRVTINNHKSTLEFTTVPGLTLEQKIELESDMLQGRINDVERKYHLQYWNDDIDINNYEWGDFYLTDISYSPEKIINNTIVYDSIKYTFIEY